MFEGRTGDVAIANPVIKSKARVIEKVALYKKLSICPAVLILREN